MEGAGRSPPHFVHSLVNGRPSITRPLSLSVPEATHVRIVFRDVLQVNALAIEGQPEPHKTTTAQNDEAFVGGQGTWDPYIVVEDVSSRLVGKTF